jgi:hypothetical protein
MPSANKTGAVISHISLDAMWRLVCRLVESFYIRVPALAYFVLRVTPRTARLASNSFLFAKLKVL